MWRVAGGVTARLEGRSGVCVHVSGRAGVGGCVRAYGVTWLRVCVQCARAGANGEWGEQGRMVRRVATRRAGPLHCNKCNYRNDRKRFRVQTPLAGGDGGLGGCGCMSRSWGIAARHKGCVRGAVQCECEWGVARCVCVGCVVGLSAPGAARALLHGILQARMLQAHDALHHTPLYTSA